MACFWACPSFSWFVSDGLTPNRRHRASLWRDLRTVRWRFRGFRWGGTPVSKLRDISKWRWLTGVGHVFVAVVSVHPGPFLCNFLRTVQWTVAWSGRVMVQYRTSTFFYKKQKWHKTARFVRWRARWRLILRRWRSWFLRLWFLRATQPPMMAQLFALVPLRFRRWQWSLRLRRYFNRFKLTVVAWFMNGAPEADLYDSSVYLGMHIFLDRLCNWLYETLLNKVTANDGVHRHVLVGNVAQPRLQIEVYLSRFVR